MIMYERQAYFVMTKQYDHSVLSGQICAHWDKNKFKGINRWDDVMKAIHEHDRSWIDLDDTPILNDAKQSPYSFIDLPLKLKLPFYTKGVDEVEEMNPYAGLLCSMHFASFFKDATTPTGKNFYKNEQHRQQRLRQHLHLNSESDMEILKFHFDLLQFGDDISLYICLQEPGVSKTEEISWYKDGFPQMFPFTDKKIVANWIDEGMISLNPFPFAEDIEVAINTKEVKKTEVAETGLANAYENAPWLTRKVKLVKL